MQTAWSSPETQMATGRSSSNEKLTKEKLECQKKLKLGLISAFCFLLSAFSWPHSVPVNSHFKIGLARIRVGRKT
jgi:ABC-type Co2+ transport system permease subunit